MSSVLQEEAARLMSRLHCGDALREREAEQQLQQWLQEDSSHVQAWQEMLDTAGQLATHAPALKKALAPAAAAFPWWQAVAASLLLCLLGAGGWEAWARWVPIEERTLQTAIGEHRRFMLSDGSEVTLNTGSQARVRLTRRLRHIDLLQGEAFFAVTHQPRAPFEVQGREFKVTVLGTRFRVLNSHRRQVVSVESGRVQVERPGQTTAILHNRQEWLALSGQAPRLRALDERELAWRDGRLVFRDQTLLDILTELQRYRPQAIRFEGSPKLAAFRLSGVFRTDNTEAFFSTLPLATPAKVERDAQGVIRVY